MNLTPAALVAHARSEAGRRAIRYSLTSLIAVAITQTLIQVFLIMGLAPVPTNLLAVMISTIPAFFLNKHWVWAKGGRAHMRREVLPFAIFTLAGWALSTLAVHYVDVWTQDSNGEPNNLAIAAANIAGFGVLWVLKYVFLDKIMFGPHHHTPYDIDIEVEEAVEEGEQPPTTASVSPPAG